MVIRELNKLVEWSGRPEQLRVDNGPEFIAQALQDWCGAQVKLIFIQRGKPYQNGFIERFNRTFRGEVLDLFAFYSPNQARVVTQARMWIYNNERPHSSLGYLNNNAVPVEIWKSPPSQERSRGLFHIPTGNYDWNFVVSM